MHEFISYNVLQNKNIFKAVSHPLNIVPSQTVNTVELQMLFTSFPKQL